MRTFYQEYMCRLTRKSRRGKGEGQHEPARRALSDKSLGTTHQVQEAGGRSSETGSQEQGLEKQEMPNTPVSLPYMSILDRQDM
jgi:hypothetical protein